MALDPAGYRCVGDPAFRRDQRESEMGCRDDERDVAVLIGSCPDSTILCRHPGDVRFDIVTLQQGLSPRGRFNGEYRMNTDEHPTGRFGFNAGSLAAEEAVEWAHSNGFGFIDFSIDSDANGPSSWTSSRMERFRSLVSQTGIRAGIHTSSAVNMAETSPLMHRATDDYLTTVIELAGRTGCGWLVVHGGYHFTNDAPDRMRAAIERLGRSAASAREAGVELWLENHNAEPASAEIHYMPHNVDETKCYFGELTDPVFKWSFNVAHAHLVPEDIDGFLDAFGAGNLAQVRLNDNRGDKEEHLLPGDGNIDFASTFARLRDLGYEGHYCLGFGTLADMKTWRDRWQDLL